nr:PREDICTED: elicitor peptide 4-like [Raphanus sativus]
METEGRRGVSYYLWFPLMFIHQTLRSLSLKLFGLRSPSQNTSLEEEEEVEVVQVTSRGLPPKKLQQKPRGSSGKPGGINKLR